MEDISTWENPRVLQYMINRHDREFTSEEKIHVAKSNHLYAFEYLLDHQDWDENEIYDCICHTKNILIIEKIFEFLDYELTDRFNHLLVDIDETDILMYLLEHEEVAFITRYCDYKCIRNCILENNPEKCRILLQFSRGIPNWTKMRLLVLSTYQDAIFNLFIRKGFGDAIRKGGDDPLYEKITMTQKELCDQSISARKWVIQVCEKHDDEQIIFDFCALENIFEKIFPSIFDPIRLNVEGRTFIQYTKRMQKKYAKP